MTSEFENKVQKALADFLSAKGFHHDESIDLDGDNKSIVIYKSPSCKLAFYRSHRDGEINCMVGTAEAKNADLNGNGWFFLNSLLSEGKGSSIEELLAAVPSSPKSYEEQLDEIAAKLKNRFDDVMKELAER